MDYELEKLTQEYESLKSLYNKLVKEWGHPSDFEDLYKVYPLLTVTGALARKYLQWDKKLSYLVDVIKPKLGDMDTSEFLYYDEKTFFNGEKTQVPLSSVTSMFLHQYEYGYMDDRKLSGKMTPKVSIYLFITTDILCESCALANNGKYKAGKNNFRKTTSFIGYSDCTCGYYVNFKSYLQALEQMIKEKHLKSK